MLVPAHLHVSACGHFDDWYLEGRQAPAALCLALKYRWLSYRSVSQSFVLPYYTKERQSVRQGRFLYNPASRVAWFYHNTASFFHSICYNYCLYAFLKQGKEREMKQEAKILLSIGIITILIIVGGALLFGSKSSGNGTNSSGPTVDKKLLINSKSHTLGPQNAKVTVVEFGDYQCPACGTAYPMTKQILNAYNGRILFVFRNFPLPQHQNAQISAEAAEAAGKQGKFWEMHDLLYQNQTQWGESTNPMDYFLKYAQELKLDSNSFKKDVQNNSFQDVIQQDMNDGNAANVNATPTFFINGEQFTQDATYDNVKQVIDGKLSS